MVDYIAVYNKPSQAIPESERAWPVYRKIVLDHSLTGISRLPGEGGYPLEADSYEVKQALKEGREPPRWSDRILVMIQIDDPRWPQAVAEVRQHAPLYQAIRQAAAIEHLGYILQLPTTLEEHAVLSAGKDWTPEPHLLKPATTFSVSRIPLNLFPYLTQSRLRKVLKIHLYHALHQSDIDSFLDTLKAMMAMSRQFKQARTHIMYMGSVYDHLACVEYVSALLEKHASSLTDAQLTVLDQLLAQATDDLTSLPPKDEPISLDMLQHLYDRHGMVDSSAIAEKRLTTPMYIFQYSDHFLHNIAQAFMFQESYWARPWIKLFTASHSAVVQELESLERYRIELHQRPLWAFVQQQHPYSELISRWAYPHYRPLRYWPIAHVEPLYLNFDWIYSSKYTVPQYEALRVAIALERYRRRTGQYPSTLQDLIPLEWDELPIDHSSGQPLLYKMVMDKPLLYGRGKNQVDDGGKYVKGSNYTANEPIEYTSDWILYPRPAAY